MGEISKKSATATRNILLIEDSASDLRLLNEAFAEADSDATLQSTTDGDDAIDVLRRVKGQDSSALPDLVLSDLHMPGRDGQAVVEAIRNELGLPNLPVIILTRSEDREDMQRCYEAQANAFLTKPTHFAELVSLAEAVERFWLDQVPQSSEERPVTPLSR